ncbi:MAG TPA: hypothetical protein VIH18_24145 [Candidatus Binatia bacterium]|jgi:hypothetical protein
MESRSEIESMPRANRHFLPGHVCHLIHRYHIGHYLYCSTGQFVVTIGKIGRDQVAFDLTKAFAF